MTEAQVFGRLKRSKGLPSLPQLLQEIIQLAKNDPSPKELIRVIRKDPSISTKILRLINSSFYSFRSKISSIEFAAAQLGSRQLLALALSTEIYPRFIKKKIMIDHLRFWRHSLETAIACREIANACGYKPVEEAFILGLVHDIGILLVEAEFPVEFKRIWGELKGGKSLLDAEESILGTNHAKIGGFLLDHWNLPKFMGEAITLHHSDFPQTEDLQCNRLGVFINLGNRISHFRILHTTQSDEVTHEKINSMASLLNLESDSISLLQSKTVEKLIEESKFLEIEIGPMVGLLKEANTLIYKQYRMVEKTLRETNEKMEEIAGQKVKQAALESLKTISATLSHYINNTTAKIMSGAERIQHEIETGNVIDNNNATYDYLELTITSIETIALFLDNLVKFTQIDTTKYTDESAILDIGDKLNAVFEAIDKGITYQDTDIIKRLTTSQKNRK